MPVKPSPVSSVRRARSERLPLFAGSGFLIITNRPDDPDKPLTEGAPMPRATRSRRAEMDPTIPEPDANGDGEVATEETPKVAAERVQITKAPDTVVAFCRRVMKEHHEELSDAGVTIAVNWAAAGENAV